MLKIHESDVVQLGGFRDHDSDAVDNFFQRETTSFKGKQNCLWLLTYFKNCRFYTVIVVVNVFFVSRLNCRYQIPDSKLNYANNFGINKKFDFSQRQIESVEITFWKA